VRRRRFTAALIAVFVVSRVAYYAAGVRFGIGPRITMIQLLPQHLLQHDLVRSLWYLNAQPPLLNALYGVLLHVPLGRSFVFASVYIAMGLALALTMFALLRELAVPDAAAFWATVVFAVSPMTVLYENWPLYTYPVALLLCVATLCFARFFRTRALRYAAGCSGALALLALTRATFHLVVVVAACALLFAGCSRQQRLAAAVAIGLPCALVAGLYLKNEMLFGDPSASSWLGMNLAHMMFRDQSPELRADVASGYLSRQALIVPFVGLDRYGAAQPHTGVPALDEMTDDGLPNYNNRAYIAISRQYERDVVRYVRRHPQLYLDRVAAGFRTYFASPADYLALRANRSEVLRAVQVENRLLGQFHDVVPPVPRNPATPAWDEIAWLPVLGYAAVVGAGVVLGWRMLRRRSARTVTARTVVFASALVTYTMVVSNTVEFGDNNRFRFETDALVWVVVVALVTAAVARRQRRAGRRGAPAVSLTAL